MIVTALTIRDIVNASSTSSLHTTNQGAYQELVNWVEGMWDDAGMGRDISTFQSNVDRVAYFFHIRKEDYQYDMERKEIYGPAVAEERPPDPNEVPLDPVEVRTVVHALRTTKFKDLGEEIRTNSYHAADIVHKIIGKLMD